MLNKIVALGLVIVFISSGCSNNDEGRKIDLSNREPVKVQSDSHPQETIRFAVGSMITPRAGFAYYHKLFKYIGDKLGRPVKLVDRETYIEINKLMMSGNLDLAIVCGRPYVDGHDEFGMELLVAPRVFGETLYFSYIIVRKESPVENLEGLRGKSFAFTDPMSNSGKLVTTYMLARIHEIPDTFFKRYVYTYAHDKSIKAVAQGIVDGAAISSLVWEYAKLNDPGLVSKLKVIEISPPYGISPVVVSQGLETELKEKIKHILLNIHKDETGREIIKKMMIDKFVVVDDSLYDSIREIKSFVTRHEEERGKRK